MSVASARYKEKNVGVYISISMFRSCLEHSLVIKLSDYESRSKERSSLMRFQKTTGATHISPGNTHAVNETNPMYSRV